MNTETYSLKEVVRRLNRTHSDGEEHALTRQIKHWTNLDLLHPLGDKNVGTGRSRRYEKQELVAAAYMRRLHNYGFIIGAMRQFRTRFDELSLDEDWRSVLMTGKDAEGKPGFCICSVEDFEGDQKRYFFSIIRGNNLSIRDPLWLGHENSAIDSLTIDCGQLLFGLKL